MTSPDAWTRAALFDGLDPTPAFVDELEKLGLLRVVGQASDGTPMYAPEARDTLERVVTLVEAGYATADIAAILAKGTRSRQSGRRIRRAPVLLTSDELADRAAVPHEAVARWLDEGLLHPDVMTDGAPRFEPRRIMLAKAYADLEAIGLGGEALRQWADLGDAVATIERGDDGTTPAAYDAIVGLLDAIRARTHPLGRVVRRWDKRLARVERQLEKARKAHLPDERPRRRKKHRKKVRTRAR